MQDEEPWYSVKCIFIHDELSEDTGKVMYEERVVVLKSGSLDEAIVLGEAEALEYAKGDGTVHYAGFISAYHLYEREIADGSEVYSLMRLSDLDKDAFLDRYHDDGSERTRNWSDVC